MRDLVNVVRSRLVYHMEGGHKIAYYRMELACGHATERRSDALRVHCQQCALADEGVAPV